MGNYHAFFLLYLNAPNMGAYIMDHFIDRERVRAMMVITRACVFTLFFSVVVDTKWHLGTVTSPSPYRSWRKNWLSMISMPHEHSSKVTIPLITQILRLATQTKFSIVNQQYRILFKRTRKSTARLESRVQYSIRLGGQPYISCHRSRRCSRFLVVFHCSLFFGFLSSTFVIFTRTYLCPWFRYLFSLIMQFGGSRVRREGTIGTQNLIIWEGHLYHDYRL
jgi:hypothetical protein